MKDKAFIKLILIGLIIIEIISIYTISHANNETYNETIIDNNEIVSDDNNTVIDNNETTPDDNNTIIDNNETTLDDNNTVIDNNEVTINNSEELFEHIAISRNREETDTSIYKIKLNPGVYSIDTHITISKNTIIDLNGNTIKYNRQNATNDYAIYMVQGAENVEIRNGIIDGGGLYGKEISKIKLNNLNFKNCSAGGICIKENSKNLEFSNLKFEKIAQDGVYAVEASIDILNGITCTDAMRGIYLKQSTAKDITNCNISNISAEGIRLVSSHVWNIKNNTISNGKNTGLLLRGPTDTLNGSSAKNIENNIITKCTGDGIGIFHGSYCKEIIKNTIDTIGGNHNGGDGDYGILVDSMMKAKTYCYRIAENTIKNVTYAGIAIYSGPGSSFSEIYQDTAYVEKNIENNKLINCGTFPHSAGWKKEAKQGCVSGIYIDTHARVKGDICNNLIEKTGENGIYIHLASRVNRIYNNTIKNCKEFGIHVYQLSIVYGNIDYNKIYNCGIDGIALTKSATVKGLIKSNTINTTTENGIYLRTSTAKGIINNTLNNIKKVGICLNDNSKVDDIISNNVTMNNTADGFGVRVVSNSKAKRIQKNTLKGKMVYGMRIVGIYDSCDISLNNVSTMNPSKKSFVGIYVDGNNSKKTTVKKNTITGNKTSYGIRIVKGKTDVLGNTIKKTTYPIYIEKNNVAVKIKDNKISNNSDNVIRTKKQKTKIGNVKITNIKAEKKKKIKLKYKSSIKVKKYEIYQATTKNGTYKKIKTTNKTTYTVSKLTANKTYFYKIYGYTNDGKVAIYTSNSKIKSVKAKK